jgi:hypothetical protein
MKTTDNEDDDGNTKITIATRTRQCRLQQHTNKRSKVIAVVRVSVSLKTLRWYAKQCAMQNTKV